MNVAHSKRHTDPSGPCRTESAQSSPPRVVDPTEVFPRDILAEVVDMLVPEQVLYEYATGVFEYRLRQFSIGEGPPILEHQHMHLRDQGEL